MHKQLFLLLIMSAVIFASPPDWVRVGTKIEYTLTQNTVTTTVLYEITSKTATEIKMRLTVGGSPSGMPTDNASADSGTFWYATSRIAGANIDDTIDEWKVMEKDVTLSAAGTGWTATKLRKTVGGLQTDRYVDPATGLLIKDENSARSVVFKSINPPFSSAVPSVQPPSSAPPAPQQPAPQPNSTQPGQQPSPPTMPQTVSPSPELIVNGTATLPSGPPPDSPDLKPPDTNVPCCPVAFILLLLGAIIVYKQQHD